MLVMPQPMAVLNLHEASTHNDHGIYDYQPKPVEGATTMHQEYLEHPNTKYDV